MSVGQVSLNDTSVLYNNQRDILLLDRINFYKTQRIVELVAIGKDEGTIQ